MNVKVLFLFSFLVFTCLEPVAAQSTYNAPVDHAWLAQADHDAPPQDDHDGHAEDAGEELHEAAEEHTVAPPWTVIPFAALLLMIATGPLFYEHFWHKNYPDRWPFHWRCWW